MNSKIFQEALQATARIACCASLVSIVACQVKGDDTSSPAINSSTSMDSAEDSAEPVEDSITIPEPPNFDDCLIAIEEGFADEGFDSSELLDCCLLTTEQIGFEDLYNNPDFADLQEDCCSEIAEQGEWSTACTPWGPPTPPCMNGEANA